MLTNGNVSLESIKETLDEMFEGQKLLLMSLGLNKEGKLKGKELQEFVEELTVKGYSKSQIKTITRVSGSSVSQKRKVNENIKADNEEIDFGD